MSPYEPSVSFNDDIALQPLVPPQARATSSTHTRKMFAYQRRASTSSTDNPFTDSTQRKQCLLSYAPDWIITIGLAAVFLALDKVDGFKRVFSLEDTSLRHPYTVHERVPNFALYMICLVAPLLLQPVINWLTVRSVWDLHNSTLGLILGLAITGAITQFTKITVGRPRPDVISRCIPIAGSVDPQWGLSSADICTQTDSYILTDGWRSFPSGHSSMSFAGLGFLSFYLSGKLHLFDKKGHAPKAWLALTPLSGAALVAISRTMDYRHHWHDVLAGSLLGLALAYFSYRQYYPSLASEISHRPYAPRIRREGPILPIHRNSMANHDAHSATEQLLNQESEEDPAPQGTVPRPERSTTSMTNLWKGEDDEEIGEQSHP